MAKAKQATTIATQIALAVLVLAVEMCTRPWIVELSRNSRSLLPMLLWRVDCRVGGNQSIKCHVKEVKTYKQGPSCRVAF